LKMVKAIGEAGASEWRWRLWFEDKIAFHVEDAVPLARVYTYHEEPRRSMLNILEAL
jgi:hypothetical protein